MKRDNWPVLEEGIRPAGKPGECFYCHEPKGGTHKLDCVIRERTVVVKVVCELVITVPEFWEPGLIDFARGENHCQSNIVGYIADLSDRLDETGQCACRFVTTSYLREAMPEDEELQKLCVVDLPS